MRESVLVVDDDLAFREQLERALSDGGHEVVGVRSSERALEALATRRFGVVFAALSLPDSRGLWLCERVLRAQPGTPVVVVTPCGTLDTALAAMRAGAADLLPKPLDLQALATCIATARAHRALRHPSTDPPVAQRAGREPAVSERRRSSSSRPRAARGAVASRPVELPSLCEADVLLHGQSRAIERVRELVGRVAARDVSVLVQGEPGTGKERVARAIHAASPRADGPFVAVDCTAVAPCHLGAVLFGQAHGARSAPGAPQGRLFEATGGTLFLDDVGELPVELQVKLLRGLEDRAVRPIGGTVERPIDVRLVTATRRNLEEDLLSGRFREDLYYRIQIIRIELPPLRARGGDLFLLAEHFLERSAGPGQPARRLTPQAAHRLAAYPWPGNVGELERCLEQAAAAAAFDELGVDDLPDPIRRHRPGQVARSLDGAEELLTLHEVERRHLLHVLSRVGGSKSRAAEILALDRRTLCRKLERYAEAPARRPAKATELIH